MADLLFPGCARVVVDEVLGTCQVYAADREPDRNDRLWPWLVTTLEVTR